MFLLIGEGTYCRSGSHPSERDPFLARKCPRLLYHGCYRRHIAVANVQVARVQQQDAMTDSYELSSVGFGHP